MENLNTSPVQTQTQPSAGKMKMVPFLILVVLAVVVGVGAGYFLNPAKKAVSTAGQTTQGNLPQSAGIADKSTFKDTAEGTLKTGGIDGVGSFHLDRPGGTSQTVYLTSTAVDLSKFVGRKVKVWGQTYQSDKAGWFMDVGYVEAQ